MKTDRKTPPIKHELHIQKFMAENRNLLPEELGYFAMKPFRKNYIFGKDKNAIDGYIKFKKICILEKAYIIIFVLIGCGILIYATSMKNEYHFLILLIAFIAHITLSCIIFKWFDKKHDKYLHQFINKVTVVKK